MKKGILLPFLMLLLAIFFAAAQTDKPLSMQDWRYPYEVKKLALSDSLEIAYVDEGKGKCTLLFIHGLGSYLKAWSPNIEALKKHYRCIAIDLPGYGKSSKADYAYSMGFFAQTVRGFVEKMGLKNVVLVGHSMGGQIAIHTVLKDPSMVEKLILIAPAGFETFTESERQWLEKVYTASLIKATPVEQIVKNFEINFHQMPEDARFMIDDRLFMRNTIEYDRYCEMIPQCVMGMLAEPVFERLSEIKAPTLVIYGENDLLIPNRLLHPAMTTSGLAKEGRQSIPNSRLQLVPLAGHFVQWEQAPAVNAAIRDFLK